MYEIPNWEELRGTDPNDPTCFKPKEGIAHKIILGPENNRWFVVARPDDEHRKKPTLALKIEEGEMYWFRPSPKTPDISSKMTVFTDLKEANRAVSAAQEKFPEFTIWSTGFTVKE